MSASISSSPPEGGGGGAVVALDRHAQRWLVWRALRMSFWVIYDHLGGFMLLNGITLLLFGLPMWLLQTYFGLPGEVIGLGLVIYMAGVSVGQCYMVSEILSGRPFSFQLFSEGIRRFVPGGLVLVVATVLVVGSGLLGSWFYTSVSATGDSLVGILLAQGCACAVLFVLMVAFYAWPALIAKGGRPVHAMRIGVSLVAVHPVASLSFVALALLGAVIAVTPPGCLLLSTIPVATLAGCAYELLARLHDGPSAVCDEDDIYLNRGFKEFLFPWKG